MLRCSRHFLPTLLVISAIATAHAAELGEARVSSHIGQPLVADIELSMLDDPAQTVTVRLASPEVYNGAGIAIPPVLASLTLSVMRRDGRQFLHVTSLRPVDSEHLHLYLELAEKGQRSVRLATLWLTPDPHPAPVPLPAPVPAVVPAPAPASAVHAEASAAPVRTTAPTPRPAAVVRKPIPAAAEPAHAKPKAPAAPPLPIHTAQPAAPAACAVPADQAKVCAALDVKNAALNAQLGALEGKVKSLQATLGAAPAPAPAATREPTPTQAPAPAPEAAPKPPGPKPISAIKPLVPRKHKAPPEPDTGLPWGWIGAGAAFLLALGGAALLLRRRARTVRNVDIPAEPRAVERLRQRFFSRTQAAPTAAPNPAAKAAPEAVEPSLE